MVDSSAAVEGDLTGSSSFSVVEWKLSSSLGGAGESSVVVSWVSSKSSDQLELLCVGDLSSPTRLYKFNTLNRTALSDTKLYNVLQSYIDVF